jgi:hypothetical protein
MSVTEGEWGGENSYGIRISKKESVQRILFWQFRTALASMVSGRLDLKVTFPQPPPFYE